VRTNYDLRFTTNGFVETVQELVGFDRATEGATGSSARHVLSQLEHRFGMV
jgi:hypothetical protein